MSATDTSISKTKRLGKLGVLLGVNFALALGLALTFFAQPKEAQAQAFGAKANYTMISGFATGRPQNAVVYVVNTNNGQLAAVFFNSANNRFEPIGRADIAADMRRFAGN